MVYHAVERSVCCSDVFYRSRSYFTNSTITWIVTNYDAWPTSSGTRPRQRCESSYALLCLNQKILDAPSFSTCFSSGQFDILSCPTHFTLLINNSLVTIEPSHITTTTTQKHKGIGMAKKSTNKIHSNNFHIIFMPWLACYFIVDHTPMHVPL